MELLEYKCPNCGGNVVFDVASQKMKCESCDSLFTQEELDAIAQIPDLSDAESSYDWKPYNDGTSLEGANTYSCQSCGAEIIADETTAASTCPFCDSPIIMMSKVSGMNQPDCVIPFKLDKKAAQNALLKFYEKKFLLPRIFKSESRLKDMKSIYVPFWLFDCDTDASAVFEGTRTRTWTQGDWIYTETRYYNIYRSGTLAFTNVPVDGSKKMDDAYMEGLEPYNFNELVPFDTSMLSGFLADKYDVDADASFPRAKIRVENSVYSALKSTISGYSSVIPKGNCIKTANGQYKYALLPVWMLTSKFNGKDYVYAVNGQTGKVSGELPIDKKKLALVLGIIGVILFALAQFIVF